MMVEKGILELLAPEFAMFELRKYASDVQQKAKIDKRTFEVTLGELRMLLHFIPIEEYEKELSKTATILQQKKPKISAELLNDIDFLCLANRYNCSLWSNDKLFKQQSQIIILETKELLILFD